MQLGLHFALKLSMIWNSNQLMDCTYLAFDGYVGPCRDLYFDDQEWVVRYFVLETNNTGTTRALISPFAVGKTDLKQREIHIALSSSKIKNSPEISIDLPISRQHEIALRRYYEWPEYLGQDSETDTLMAKGIDEPFPPTEDLSSPIPGQIDSPDSDKILSDTTEEILPEEPVDDNLTEADFGLPEEDVQYSTTLRSAMEIKGYRIQTTDGDHSSIAELLIDDSDWSIKYLVINLQNSHSDEFVLLTLHFVKAFDWGSSRLFCTLSQQQLQNAPRFIPNQKIDTEYERSILRYYDSI